MAGHAAYQSLGAAVAGDHVPHEHRMRSVYSPVDVQGGHGSAQIPLMHAVNDMWYSWHHGQRDHARRVLDVSWRGYFDLDWWMTKEPYGIHVYQGWIEACYHSVRAFAILVDNDDLIEMVDAYLFRMFAVDTLMGYWDEGKANVARPGCRSWVGGGDRHEPYAHIVGPNLGKNSMLTSQLGKNVNLVAWSSGVIEAAQDVVPAYTKWGYISSRQRILANKIVRMEDSADEMVEFLEDAEETGAKAHTSLVCIRTDKCGVNACEKSWSSGSTSFLYAKGYYPNGRPNGPWYEFFADDVDRRWGWLAACGYHRKADCGGVAEIADDYSEVRCQTRNDKEPVKKIGKDENGNAWFAIPSHSYWHQPSGTTTEERAYKSGWRSIPVVGHLDKVRAVRFVRGNSKFEVLAHPGGLPDNGNGGNGGGSGKSPRQHVRTAQRQLDRSLKNRPPTKALVKKAEGQLKKALEKIP